MSIKNKIIFALLMIVCIGFLTSLVFLAEDKTKSLTNDTQLSVDAVTSADGEDDSLKGGAIYLSPNSEFTMNGGIITGHESTYGGAVYVSNGATFTMEGGIIESASATNGGAIYVAAGGTCIINGGTITECTVTGSGGAIYVEDGGILKIEGSVITSGDEGVPEYSVSITKNSAGIKGGAIYMHDSTIDATLTLKNVTFEENQAQVNGGAVRVKGYITLDGNNVSLINNMIVQGSTDGTRGRGAGIYAEPQSSSLEDQSKMNVNLRGYSYFVGNIINTNASQQVGGAVCLFSGGSLLIERGIIKGNQIPNSAFSGRGGAIYIYNNANVTLGVEGSDPESLIFEENYASDTSGAVAVYASSTATIYSAKLTKNSSGQQGGAMYATQSTINLEKNVLLDNNFSVRGGAISLFQQNSTLNINGSTFDSNKLKNTSAVGSRYGAHIYSNGSTINFNSGTISNGDAYNSESIVYGGAIAILNNGSNKSKLNIKDGVIRNCKAVNGGAIHCSSVDISVEKLIIDNCQATGYGGGLYIIDSSDELASIVTKFDNINIENCVSGVSGGAMYFGSLSNLSMTINKIDNNTSRDHGGAFYFSKPINLNISGVNNSSGSISSNTSGIFGGAICLADSAVMVSDNVNYNYNKIDGSKTNNGSEGQGGAIYLQYGGSITINSGTLNGNSITTNDSKYQYGAAVCIMKNSTFTIKNGEMCNNIIYDTSGVEGRGGAVFAFDHSTANIGVAGASSSSVLIKDNHAYETSGALAVYSFSTLNLYAGTLSGNSTMIGGAIYATESIVNLESNAIITGNTASSRGGGVCLFNNSTLNINGASITKNKVLGYGGGVETQKSTINFKAGIISENGAYNNATIYGGGIALRQGSTMNFTGGTISNNTAYHGAGILLAESTSGSVKLTMTNGTIQDCKANGNGGGVCIYAGATFTFTKGAIKNCSANLGGAVYILVGGIYSNSSGTISGCTSTTGNPVYQAS